jgi:hypothetical protein
MPRIAKTLTSGLQALERRATRPKHFSDAALLKVRDLGKMTSPETPVVKIGNGTAPIPLSARLIANVESVLAPELESIGTVEGRLQGLIIHGKTRFLLFDPLSDRQVICFISGAVEWQRVRDAIGKRVAATGRIQSRRSGEKVSMIVSRFVELPDDSELPSASDVFGILKTAK